MLAWFSKWAERNVLFFQVFNTALGITTALFIFGIVKSKPGYFVVANSTMKIFLAAWLLYRFHTNNKKPLTVFDRHVCMACGAFILMSTLADAFQISKFISENKIVESINNGFHALP